MQIQITPLSTVSVKCLATFSADEISAYMDRAMKKVGNSARVDGFRKGHIPKAVLLQFYSSRIGEEAFYEIVSRNFSAMVKRLVDEDYHLVQGAAPNSEFDKLPEYGNGWSYTSVFSVFPKIDPINLGEIEAEVVKAEVTEDDRKTFLDRLRLNFGEYVDGTDLVVNTDEDQQVDIDFVGLMGEGEEQKPFEGGSATGFVVSTKETRMIPGFVEGLAGHKAGDKFTLDLTFPEDYPVADLAGKKAAFQVTINSVKVKQMAPLDEEFCKKLGFGADKDNPVEALLDSMGKNLENQARDLAFKHNFDAVLDAVRAKIGDLEVPSALVEMQSEEIIKRNLGLNKSDESMTQEERSLVSALMRMHKPGLEIRLQNPTLRQVLVNQLDFDYEPTQEEIDAELALRAASFEDQEDSDFEAFKKKASSDAEVMSLCRSSITSHKLLERIKSLMKSVTEKTVSLSELIDIENEYATKQSEAIEAAVMAEVSAAQVDKGEDASK